MLVILNSLFRGRKMHKIRSWLYVGNYAESENAALLEAQNITAVLQVAHPVNVPGVTSLYLPVSDDVPLPKSAVVIFAFAQITTAARC